MCNHAAALPALARIRVLGAWTARSNFLLLMIPCPEDIEAVDVPSTFVWRSLHRAGAYRRGKQTNFAHLSCQVTVVYGFLVQAAISNLNFAGPALVYPNKAIVVDTVGTKATSVILRLQHGLLHEPTGVEARITLSRLSSLNSALQATSSSMSHGTCHFPSSCLDWLD